MGMTENSEKRLVDSAANAVQISQEAAELAEHIRDTQPTQKREELFELLITMIDDAHEESLRTHVKLEDADD